MYYYGVLAAIIIIGIGIGALDGCFVSYATTMQEIREKREKCH